MYYTKRLYMYYYAYIIHMVTVSHIVTKLVNEKIYLHEAISKKIASYGSVAKQLKPEIEKELGKEVKHSAIKTNIIDINVVKTQALFDKLKRFYEVVDFERGDILHVIYGRTHVAIITNERYRKKILDLLQYQKIKKVEEDLVALSFTVGRKRIDLPGVLFQVTRNLAWENINIIEIISVNVEVTFIVDKKDAVKGYNALEKLIA